jgi:hypothetical protein
MYSLLNVLVLGLASSQGTSASAFTAEDGLVLEAAVKDFLAQDEFKTFAPKRGTYLAVYKDTCSGPREAEARGFYREQEFRDAVDPQMWSSLISRNKEISPIDHVHLPPEARFGTEREIQTGASVFHGMKVDSWVAGYTQFCKPGYSGDKTKAVVWFHFGFTSHGASGVIALTKSKGLWQASFRRAHIYP